MEVSIRRGAERLRELKQRTPIEVPEPCLRLREITDGEEVQQVESLFTPGVG
jgi:hypothetical protein